MTEEEGIRWDELIFGRQLDELVLVRILKKVDKDGVPVSDEEVLKHLEVSVKGEREMIRLHGRKMAAKLYGAIEGVTSDMKTVDFVLHMDFVGYYKKLLAGENPRAEEFMASEEAVESRRRPLAGRGDRP